MMKFCSTSGSQHQSSRPFLAALSVLLVYNLLLTTAVGWLVIKCQQYEKRIDKLERPADRRETADTQKQKLFPSFIVKSPSSMNRTNPREEREVLSSKSPKDSFQMIGGIPERKTPLSGTRTTQWSLNVAALTKYIVNTTKNILDEEMKRVKLSSLEPHSGRVYIRWGRTSCPKTASLVSKGIAAGTPYTKRGGAANYLCLPHNPEYDPQAKSAPNEYSSLSSVEYQDPLRYLFSQDLSNHDAPCVYCQTQKRSQTLMLPALLNCPSGWTEEYEGFLMSAGTGSYDEARGVFVCVDKAAEALPASSSNTNGALWSHVVANCLGTSNSLSRYCLPYKHNIPFSCVVCSK